MRLVSQNQLRMDSFMYARKRLLAGFTKPQINIGGFTMYDMGIILYVGLHKMYKDEFILYIIIPGR